MAMMMTQIPLQYAYTNIIIQQILRIVRQFYSRQSFFVDIVKQKDIPVQQQKKGNSSQR